MGCQVSDMGGRGGSKAQSSNHLAKGAWSARGAAGSQRQFSDLLAGIPSVLTPVVATVSCTGPGTWKRLNEFC